MKNTGFYVFAQFVASVGTAGLCISSLWYHYKIRKRIGEKVGYQKQLTIYEYFYQRIALSQFTPSLLFGISYFSNIHLWLATKTLENQIKGTPTNIPRQLTFNDVAIGIPLNIYMMGFFCFNGNYPVYYLSCGIYTFYAALTGCYCRIMNGALSYAPIAWLKEYR